MTGIRTRNISQFGGGVISDGFLKTAAALNSTNQVIKDQLGNSSLFNLGTQYTGWTNALAGLINDVTKDSLSIFKTTTSGGTSNGYKFLVNGLGKIGIGNLGGSYSPIASLDIVGEGSTSATKSGLIKNGSGNTILEMLDDQSILGYSGSVKRFKLGFSSGGQEISTRDGQLSIGLIDANSSAAVRILTTGTGYTYIDGYTEGAELAQNYPLVLGARNSNTGIGIVGATTQEKGTPIIIGSQIYEPTAILNINSTTRGILFPRMTTAQRNAIVSPANSLTVFDTDLDTICFYSSLAGGWRQVSNSAA
jgi:hypothetical protein